MCLSSYINHPCWRFWASEVRLSDSLITPPTGFAPIWCDDWNVMAISTEMKQKLRSEYGQSDNDTGSPQIQIACLTHQINVLTEHLRSNKKDHSSRRGLLRMVSRRRRHLDYLKANAPEQYLDMISRLGIRK